MSGHSKWSTIKHKKAAVDAKRGKAFSRISKEITIAAKIGGGDADSNPRLRLAILNAKSVNMPKDNVTKAIKKGTGELGGDVPEEMAYEGYAAGGVAVMVDCLSDNRNRTAADIRSIFTKNNGSLGVNGAVSWIFHRKAQIIVNLNGTDEEALMEIVLDTGAEGFESEDGIVEITGPQELFEDLLTAIHTTNLEIVSSARALIPDNSTEVTDPSIAKQVLRLIEQLEENDDVQDVYSNFDISEEILEEIAGE